MSPKTFVFLVIFTGLSYCATASAKPEAAVNAKSVAFFETALRLEEKGEIEDALFNFQEAINRDIHNVNAHLHYQRIMAEQERMGFVDDYDALIFDYDKDPLINFLFGHALALSGRVERAKKYFEKAIALDADCYWAINGLGTYYQMNGKFENALQQYSLALKKNSRFADAYVNRGILYVNMAENDGRLKKAKLYDMALQDFASAIAVDPKNVQAYQARLNVYKEEEDFENMESALTELINMFPENPSYFFDRARLRLGLNQIETALVDLNDALRIQSNFTAARVLRANLYLAMKRTDDAMSDFNLGCQLAGTTAAPYLARGLAYARLENFDAALADFSTAVTNEPKNKQGYANRGTVYCQLSQQDLEKAVADFTKAIELDPRYFEAYLNRGSAYAMQKSYDNAVDDFTAAMEMKPNDAILLQRLDACYAAMEKEGQAVHSKREQVRKKRLLELRQQVNAMSTPEKSIFISGVCQELANKFSPSGLDILVDLSVDDDWHVRFAVAKYLGITGAPSCAPPLVPMLKDKDRHVRAAAAMAYAFLKGKDSVIAIIPLLQDQDDYVSNEALRFLRDLTGQTYEKTDSNKWQAWWAVYTQTKK